MRLVLVATVAIALAGAVLVGDIRAQSAGGTTHNVFGSLVSFR